MALETLASGIRIQLRRWAESLLRWPQEPEADEGPAHEPAPEPVSTAREIWLARATGANPAAMARWLAVAGAADQAAGETDTMPMAMAPAATTASFPSDEHVPPRPISRFQVKRVSKRIATAPTGPAAAPEDSRPQTARAEGVQRLPARDARSPMEVHARGERAAVQPPFAPRIDLPKGKRGVLPAAPPPIATQAPTRSPAAAVRALQIAQPRPTPLAPAAADLPSRRPAPSSTAVEARESRPAPQGAIEPVVKSPPSRRGAAAPGAPAEAPIATARHSRIDAPPMAAPRPNAQGPAASWTTTWRPGAAAGSPVTPPPVTPPPSNAPVRHLSSPYAANPWPALPPLPWADDDAEASAARQALIHFERLRRLDDEQRGCERRPGRH